MPLTLKLFLLIVSVEAIVELWRRSGPTYHIREWLIAKTPWLYHQALQTHPLDCGTCLSVWVSVLMTIWYFWWDTILLDFVVVWLGVTRLSNILHIGFSYTKDKQMNLRIKRGTRR